MFFVGFLDSSCPGVLLALQQPLSFQETLLVMPTSPASDGEAHQFRPTSPASDLQMDGVEDAEQEIRDDLVGSDAVSDFSLSQPVIEPDAEQPSVPPRSDVSPSHPSPRVFDMGQDQKMLDDDDDLGLSDLLSTRSSQAPQSQPPQPKKFAARRSNNTFVKSAGSGPRDPDAPSVVSALSDLDVGTKVWDIKPIQAVDKYVPHRLRPAASRPAPIVVGPGAAVENPEMLILAQIRNLETMPADRLETLIY